MKFINTIGLRSQVVKFFTTLFFTLALAACGGGGAPDLLPGRPLANAFYTTAPSALSLGKGAIQNFSLGGGTPLYSASSANPGVARAAVNGSTLTITAVATGTAQITVFDSVGTSISATVTVAPNEVVPVAIPLFATAPSAVTQGVGAATSYSIGGGYPPYFQSSSNIGVATSTVNGTTLTITGVSSGVAQVSVFDSTGATLRIGVTVGPSAVTPLYMTASSTIASMTGAESRFAIGGGIAPYIVSSSNSGVARVALSGAASFTLTAVTAGTAQIVVFDASGSAVSTTLTVTDPPLTALAALYVASPQDVSLSVGSAASYGIGGGMPPYTASSSNLNVSNVSINATSLIISGVSSGMAQAVVFDAVGKSVTVSVTVNAGVALLPLTVSPSASTAAIGDVLSFGISGGSGSYSSVSVHNANIASLSTSSDGTYASSLVNSGATFFVKLLNLGTTTVAVVDSLGQTATLSLTVIPPVSTLSLSPNALTIGEDSVAPVNLKINGGVAPFTALTDDLLLTSVNVPENTSVLEVGLGSNKNRCITPTSETPPRDYVANGIYNVKVTVIDALGVAATAILGIKDNGVGTGAVNHACN